MNKMDIVLTVAQSFLGVPYIWGGSHPSTGFDCSGLIQELLATVGKDPPGDQTAQSLYENFKSTSQTLDIPKQGCILFFGHSKASISHVAFAIDDLHMVESGGGGSSTLTIKDAIAHHAFVRVRPIANRKDLVACLLPKY